VDGVLPTKLPPTSMSAPSGVDDTWTRACSDVEIRMLPDEFPAATVLRGLESGEVEFHVSADVGGDFGAFGDGDVLAVHEEEERGGGKKYQAGGDDASGHRSGVASALRFFYGAESGFLAVGEADVVDVDVEFTAASHATLGLGFGHRRECHPTFGDDEDVVEHDILEDFEVNGLSDGGVGGGDRAIGSNLDGGAVFESEAFWGLGLLGLWGVCGWGLGEKSCRTQKCC
jgi:hypothetical protein